MKIKLDENLPVRLAAILKNLGHDVDTPREESLVGHSDAEVWQASQNEARFLITQDMDFSDSRKFAPGQHHGILLVRLRSPKRKDLTSRIGDIFRAEDVEGWARCFVVATERKIRVLRVQTKQKT